MGICIKSGIKYEYSMFPLSILNYITILTKWVTIRLHIFIAPNNRLLKSILFENETGFANGTGRYTKMQNNRPVYEIITDLISFTVVMETQCSG